MTLTAKWKATIDDALTNAHWGDYDSLVRTEVAAYNTRFASTPGFSAPDWKLFKAILWTESGGPSNDAWTHRAMQVGNPGDSALGVLRGQQESASLVMSASLKADISGSIDAPRLNIRAGIAYVYVRLCKSEFQSVKDPADKTDHTYKVVAGDSLDKIAKKVGTTVDLLKEMNPKAKVIHPGDVLTYRKASIQRVITGWLTFSNGMVAQRYNGGGDADYADKLAYCLATMAKIK
jgi:hypothetical protein